MSELKPLMELVREWRNIFHNLSSRHFGDHQAEDIANTYRICADELEVWARAQDEEIEKEHGDPGGEQWFNGVMEAKMVREKLLGVPAKSEQNTKRA